MAEKTGIITFHRAVNYGAVLQTYALQKFLNDNGKTAEVLDYECEKFRDDYKILKVYDRTVKGILKSLLKVPMLYTKQKKFDAFRARNIRMSEKEYDAENINEANRRYGMFITGSDQVWNLSLTGWDRNYLLHFVEDHRRKLSYAASMGSVDVTPSQEQILREDLDTFQSITVREENAKQYLEGILGKPVETVLDPVFLLDRETWSLLAAPVRLENYILVYCLHEPGVYTLARELSQATGLRVVCIQNGLKKPIPAEYILSAGPEEFLGYVKNASYVVTDSFHGAAFSILFGRPLKVVLKQKLAGLNARLLTLLNTFQMEDAIADGKTETAVRCEETVLREQVGRSRQQLLSMFKEQRNDA